MTNPPEQPADEQDPRREEAATAGSDAGTTETPAGTDAGTPESPARETRPADEPATADADGARPTDERAGGRRSRTGLLIGVGVAGLAAVALVLAAAVWPGFLAGPGAPDETAAAAVSALAAKNAADLDAVTCRTPDGRPTAQLPPQALELIQRVEQTGPPTLLLDTQASAPVDLTLSGQGRTENVPADLLLAVTDDEWCLNGVAPRA